MHRQFHNGRKKSNGVSVTMVTTPVPELRAVGSISSRQRNRQSKFRPVMKKENNSGKNGTGGNSKVCPTFYLTLGHLISNWLAASKPINIVLCFFWLFPFLFRCLISHLATLGCLAPPLIWFCVCFVKCMLFI